MEDNIMALSIGTNTAALRAAEAASSVNRDHGNLHGAPVDRQTY